MGIQYGHLFTSRCSIESFSSSSLKLLEKCRSLCKKPENLCGRAMIGVKAGDGMGVGNSRIGDKHLFVFELGTSSKIVGGFNELLLVLLVVDL